MIVICKRTLIEKNNTQDVVFSKNEYYLASKFQASGIYSYQIENESGTCALSERKFKKYFITSKEYLNEFKK